MIYSEDDYCEMFERELEINGDEALKFCELCELQKTREIAVTRLTQINFGDLRRTMKN